MIEINLRPGQKRARSGSSLADLRSRLSGLATTVKDPLPMAAAAVLAAVVLFLGMSWLNAARQLSSLEPRLEQARQENQRFKNFVAQKRKVELIRDSVLAQIDVIRRVDGDRYVWAHVMDEVARALPSYTWLVDIGGAGGAGVATRPGAPVTPGQPVDTTTADTTAVRKVAFQITGRTVDIQAFTRFLRQLEASPWVTDVVPISAQTVVEKERPVTAFSIKANFRQADSAYIRTAPLSQSVR
jgi:type IV pilus assembly protein PilN